MLSLARPEQAASQDAFRCGFLHTQVVLLPQTDSVNVSGSLDPLGAWVSCLSNREVTGDGLKVPSVDDGVRPTSQTMDVSLSGPWVSRRPVKVRDQQPRGLST